MPLPLPLAPLSMVSQAAPLDAVHAHAAGSVTATVPCAPAAATEAPVGASAAVQTTPAWVTVKVWPPTVIVPVREASAVFAATAKFTVPSPEPLAPDVMVIHEAAEEADQEQPARVSTVTLPLVAPAGTEALTGAMSNVHAWPAWVTLKTCPAIVIVPLREEVAGLAATL